MTLGFLLLTSGAALIYTGFKNMSVADLALNRPGPGQPPPIVDPASYSPGAASTGGGNTSTSTGSASIDKRVSGVGNWRGTPVAKWMLPVFTQAVKAGWDGCLVSGYRSPAESAAICQQKCGAPTCTSPPCAGAGSNHSGKRFPNGAVDVCNPADFQAAMNKIGNPLRNSLGASDPNHFSVSGR